MKIDDIARKRIQKFLDSNWEDTMRNPDLNVQNIACGAYCGAIKILHILNIDIDDKSKGDDLDGNVLTVSKQEADR